MTITELARDAKGVWRAVIVLDEGKRQAVDREFGSWRYTPADPKGRYWDCEPFLAALLQTEVRPIEAAERKAAKAAA